MKLILEGDEPNNLQLTGAIDEQGIFWKREGKCNHCGKCCLCEKRKHFRCEVYDQRPMLCQLYPFKINDNCLNNQFKWRKCGN